MTMLEFSSGKGPWTYIGTRKVLNLTGWDILGIVSNPEFQRFLLQKIAEKDLLNRHQYVNGSLETREETTRLFCQYKGFEETVFFAEPYSPFLSIIETLIPQGFTVLIDEDFDPHISSFLRNLSDRIQFFPHNSVESLQKRLEESSSDKHLIFIQTLYPFSSDFAHLKEIIELAGINNFVVVYESWGDGFIGEKGEGLISLLRNLPANLLVTGYYCHILPFPLAYLGGYRTFIELLKNNSVTMKACPSASDLQLEVLKWFVRNVETDNLSIKRVQDNSNYLRYELLSRGFKVLGEFTPLLPLFVGERERALEFQLELLDNGVFVKELTYPFVAPGKSRLLLIPSFLHLKEDLDFAIKKIEEAGKSLGVI